MPAKIGVPEDEIVAAYRSGRWTMLELGDRFGVSKRTIGRVLRAHAVPAARPAHARSTSTTAHSST